MLRVLAAFLHDLAVISILRDVLGPGVIFHGHCFRLAGRHHRITPFYICDVLVAVSRIVSLCAAILMIHGLIDCWFNIPFAEVLRV
jgi:hypothetical protein